MVDIYLHVRFAQKDLRPENLRLHDLGNGSFQMLLCDSEEVRVWVGTVLRKDLADYAKSALHCLYTCKLTEWQPRERVSDLSQLVGYLKNKGVAYTFEVSES